MTTRGSRPRTPAAPGRSAARSAAGRERPSRKRSELVGRIAVAIPAALFAIFIVVQGGLIFALGLIALGVVALNELYGLMRRARPVDLAGYVAVAGMVVLATYEQRADILIALVAVVPVAFLLAMMRPSMANISWGMAATVLGVVWIGLPLVHAVFLRSLDHGDGLVIDVLIATFVGDTAAYAGGRMWGRRKLAPDISPNKTVEGLIAGIVGATLAFWCAGLYQDWLSGVDALLIGFLVALAAPLGDLFESAVKRDLDVKDSGRVFGAHGGALDRLDAVFFTIVVGFYAALLLGYG